MVLDSRFPFYFLTLAVVGTCVAQWEEMQLADGLLWRRGAFDNMYGRRQHINILQVDLGEPSLTIRPLRDGVGSVPPLPDSSTTLHEVIMNGWNYPAGVYEAELLAKSQNQESLWIEPHQGCRKTSDLGQATGAIAMVNGGFFDGACGSVSFLKLEEIVYDFNPTTPRSTYGETRDEEIIFGVLGYNETWEETSNGLGGGPNLVTNGKPDVTLYEEGFDDAFNNKHPRTAVGVTHDNQLLMITVDGRTLQAGGMTLDELADFMISLNIVDGVNLDGGGSTTCYVAGQPHAGVVNYPSDNGRSNHEGERSVVTALGIYHVDNQF
eukprot:NODE_894_length_1130_cov_105.117647_g852_i0.p1 GENE.NODE_894_length_1130_cov_105.117647_g852_i0~~NODE_894_length_1130_cov_105.117647_g852_i0.p1  ORF type:complete len:323 (+),score=55.51 NODE_894_length_1130_cov_105.117647_g852_i0:81-1049(+)